MKMLKNGYCGQVCLTKMTVRWISLDQQRFDVRHGKVLMPPIRHVLIRRCGFNTLVHNQIYKVNLILFEPAYSKIWHFLNRVIPGRLLSHRVTHPLARLMSTILGIDLPREVYRREKPLWYWLERNYNYILECFAEHRISIKIGKCVYVLS